MSDGILRADSNGGRFALKKIDLNDCSLDAAGIKELARCLHLLEEVNISGNKLTVNHVRHISDGILAAVLNGEVCALKKVNLANCLIDVASFKELAQCLHLLEEIDLSGNKLTVNGVRHISDGILLAVANGGRSALKKVNLAKSLIDVAGMKELVRCLHLVEEFDFSGNKLTVSHVWCISDGILADVADGGQFELRKLDLRNCSIASDGMVELERSLRHVEIVFN